MLCNIIEFFLTRSHATRTYAEFPFTLMMEMELFFETSDFIIHLKRLSARENFIVFLSLCIAYELLSISK